MTRWERILKTHLLRYSPLKPIQYSETVRLVEKLSTCGKIEFLDTTENIASLLPFLNDNQDKIKYLSGIEPFFKVARGWKIYPVRENYVEKRLHIMLSSGIYGHWETWFRLLKSPKLFHHYANWTRPRYNAVSQLDNNSKIVTGFYVCGICLGGCLLCLGYEILSIMIRRRLNDVHQIFKFSLNKLI